MIGDQADVAKRITDLLPPWFADSNPILDALIQGLAWAGSFIYSLYAYAKLQTRIKTATDGWLDMISADFFGTALPRQARQSDTSFRNRIIINMFRERATRNGITKVLIDLTGRAPRIFELQRPTDTGAYGVSTSGYGLAGGYGSMLLPFQAFVTAYRPTGSGVPNVAGYGITMAGTGYPLGGQFIPEPSTPGPGGYGVGAIEYASLDMIQGTVTDSDIYAAVDSVKPIGTIVWTNITA